MVDELSLEREREREILGGERATNDERERERGGGRHD